MTQREKSTRSFRVTLEIEATLDLDEAVIAQVTDEWRSRFYPLHTPEEIAEHIGRNMILGTDFAQLDGFADLPRGSARIRVVNEDCTAEEGEGE